MISKNKISYGYCVINILNGIEQNLQFFLVDDMSLFQTYQRDSAIKKLLKKTFNYFYIFIS